MQRYFFLLAALFSFLYADLRSEEEIQGRLSADRQPLAAVAGCVNAVSGSFFFSERDLPPTGLGRLGLIRTYDSANSYKGFFGKGMLHGFPIELLAAAKKCKDKQALVRIGLPLSEFSRVLFGGFRRKDGSMICEADPLLGLYSDLGASLNPLNRFEPVIRTTTFSSARKGEWTAHLSNGTKQHFKKERKLKHKLFLEEFPDGQYWEYTHCRNKSFHISQKDSKGAPSLF